MRALDRCNCNLRNQVRKQASNQASAGERASERASDDDDDDDDDNNGDDSDGDDGDAASTTDKPKQTNGRLGVVPHALIHWELKAEDWIALVPNPCESIENLSGTHSLGTQCTSMGTCRARLVL